MKDQESYEEFRLPDDVHRWGNTLYENWKINHMKAFQYISRSESPFVKSPEPIQRYCGDNFNQINKLLRTGHTDINIPDIPIIIHTLVYAIYTAPRLDKNLIVYRQVCEEMINDLERETKKGLPYHEKGFLSTSLLKSSCLKECGDQPYMLKIYVPSGTPAIYVNSVTFKCEEELLFPPDQYLLARGNSYKDASNKTIYEVEMLNYCLF